jgi:hypothetical protein
MNHDNGHPHPRSVPNPPPITAESLFASTSDGFDLQSFSEEEMAA